MWEEGVTEWYQNMVHPSDWMDSCVGHACVPVACVSLTLVFHVLVSLHRIDHCSSKAIMRNLMSVLWNASP